MNSLALQQAGATTIAKLDGPRLARGIRRQLSAQLREHLTAGQRLIVDCSSWITLDSEALILIMELVRRAREADATIWIAGLQPGPAAIAEMVRLSELACIHATVEEAVRAAELEAANGGVEWNGLRPKRTQGSRAMAAGA
jgi:anti-anti-sigma regulatory factor